jgi:hypothetical protein
MHYFLLIPTNLLVCYHDSLVLYTDVKQLRREAEWDGATGVSRKTLLHRLTGIFHGP